MPTPATTAASTVSVVIAAYNAEPFLRRAVESALRQNTNAVLELLIVDDASTDGTVSRIRELASSCDKIRLVSLPVNKGPSGARNAGLDAASGDWIAILDADDAFLPERLTHMLEVADTDGADIVADTFRYYDPATEHIGPAVFRERALNPELITVESFVRNARPFGDEPDWGLLKPLFRKSFLERNRLRYATDCRHGEDFLLIFEALLHGARYLLTRQSGYLYTVREAGLSRTIINYSLMCKHTEALVSDPRVISDPTWVAALGERVESLRRLDASHEVSRYWRDRKISRIVHKMVADYRIRSVVRGKIQRRLASLLTRA